MKVTLPIRLRIAPRVRWGLATAGLLLLTTVLIGGTLRLLHDQTARLTAPTDSGVEIPTLDRALLTEFARRVPL